MSVRQSGRVRLASLDTSPASTAAALHEEVLGIPRMRNLNFVERVENFRRIGGRGQAHRTKDDDHAGENTQEIGSTPVHSTRLHAALPIRWHSWIMSNYLKLEFEPLSNTGLSIDFGSIFENYFIASRSPCKIRL